MLKIGRTQLQDAVPMTLGQEFSAFAVMLAEDEARLDEAALLIREINLGATAIGTGINAHPDYAALVCRKLGRHHRDCPRHRAQPGGGHPGRGRLRAALRRAQAHRREAVEELQRPAPAVLGPARRLQRDQPAGRAGRLQHHAGQGQPGDPGGGQPGRLRGDRQRRHRQLRRRSRPAPAQRLRADHRAQPVQEHRPPAPAPAARWPIAA